MPCITLLSDFGLQDASVAAAKGILMQHLPAGTPIIDVSHLVETFHLQQAAYLLLSAYRHFPEGSCHVLLFDVFFDRAPRLVLCAHNGHYFLAPDNGVLSLALGPDVEEVWQCYEHSTGNFSDWLGNIGQVAAKLQTQQAKELSLPGCQLKVAPQHWLPKEDGDTLECHVIHIDRYENVVINVTQEQFERHRAGRSFRIQFMRDEELTQISTHFYNVGEGQKLCRFNATGFLEIAINRGGAASLFGFKLFREKHLIYNSIKIFFGS